MKDFSFIFIVLIMGVGVYAEEGSAANASADHSVSMKEGMTPTQQLVNKELEMVRIDEKVGNTLNADLTFYNKEGRPVVLKDYLGDKPLVLSFAYYSCSLICQFVLQGEVDVFNRLGLSDLVAGEDFRAVTISFDPNDDAELTAKMTEIYADKVSSEDSQNPEWTFLYGEEKEIKSITEQLGFYYDFIEANGEFAHSAAIYIITPQGRISRYFYGIQFNPFDLQLALIEAKDEISRTTIEKILMFCYQYSAESRGYALVARKVMKAGGLVTVVFIGMFIVLANNKRIRLIGKK